MANVLKIARGQGVLLAGNLVNRLLDLVIIIWLTNSLGLERFGGFYTVYIYYTFWALLTELGMSGIVAREVARDPGRARQWAGAAWLVSLAMAALILPAAYVSIDWVYPGQGYRPLAAAVSLAVLGSSKFLTFAKVVDALFVARARFAYLVVLDVAERVFFLVGFALAPEQTPFWALLMLGCAGIPGLLAALVLHGRLFGWPDLRVRLATLRPLLRAALPTFLGGTLFLVNFKLDVLMLAGMRGAFETGLYGAASRVPESLAFLGTVAMMPMIPILARKYVANRDAFIRVFNAAAKYLLVVTVFLSAYLALYAAPVLALLFPEETLGGLTAIRVLFAAEVGVVLLNGYNIMLVSSDRQRLSLVFSLLSMLVNVGLNLVLIPRWGINGAAAATLVSYWLYCPLGLLVGWTRPVSGRLLLNLVRCGVAAAVMMIGCRALGLGMFTALVPAALVYAVTFLLLRGLDVMDIEFVQELLPRFNPDARVVRWALNPGAALRDRLRGPHVG